MHSFVDIEQTLGGQPPKLGSILARIDVGRGREQLYRDQVPELLRSPASQSRVESISASSAVAAPLAPDVGSILWLEVDVAERLTLDGACEHHGPVS
jgi:hypothetical protein